MARPSKFPPKTPREYIVNTLKRFLPSDAEIARLSKPALAALLRKRDELTHLIRVDPLRFFHPNPGGQTKFLTAWDTEPNIIVQAFFAGNKTGKTTAGGILTGERLLGRALWGRESRNISYPVPSRGAVFAEDFESHNETILPTLLSWLPANAIRTIQRNSAGHVTQVQFNNGSVLHFKTFVQGSDTAEGKDWDIVWFDEPPPRSLYTAVFRGLVSLGGKMCITATLLKETWLFDEMEHEFVRAYQASIFDNPWISPEARDAFLASLPDEEREVRESGKPISLTGLIYKSFMDMEPYVFETVDLPSKAPYIIGVDPHERRPLHAAWAFITPLDEIVWFDWLTPRGDTETIFSALRERERVHNIVPRLCIMDPNRGKATQINQTCWQDEFEKAGYDVVLGQDDLNIGHTTMYNYLKIQDRTKRPRMFWTAGCRGRYGPIWQMLRYSWDEWAHKSIRSQREPKEKPKSTNKDFPDIHRYTAMENLQHDSLLHGFAVIDRFPKGLKTYGQVASPW